LRAFQLFGEGQATCYGPVAESFHAANERVHIPSVMQVAKNYALFLARWCGISENQNRSILVRNLLNPCGERYRGPLEH
jgi:hypothetical protein